MPFVRNITCKYFLPVHDSSYQQLLNLHQSCLFRKLPLNPLSLPPNSILGSHFSLLCPPRQSPPQLPSQLQLLPRGGTQTYVCNPHFFSETQIHLFDCQFVIFPQTSPRPPKLNMFPNKLITWAPHPNPPLPSSESQQTAPAFIWLCKPPTSSHPQIEPSPILIHLPS